MDATFTYSQLNEELKEIRLLDIRSIPRPSDAETRGELVHDHLQCHIRNVSLNAVPKPSYETVSYCWGDPTPSEAIMIDGRLLIVPIETIKVLLRLAPTERTRCIWIDAICIDQGNILERGQQVSLMAEIYGHGTVNQIYLGEEHPLSTRAVHHVLTINEEFAAALQEGQEWWDLVWSRTGNLEMLKTTIDVDALVYLYSCKWFTRLWVVQEALLANENICILGSIVCELAPILRIPVLLIHQLPHYVPDILYTPALEGFPNAAYLWLMQREHTRSTRAIMLHTALIATQTLDCTEVRDRVFGVLGITQKQTRLVTAETAARLLAPDYEKSVADVGRDTARFCIVQSGRLDILHQVDHRNSHSLNRPGYSSWALSLDHRTRVETDAGDLPVVVDPTEKFEMLDDLALMNWPTDDIASLAVKGFSIGSITACSRPLEPNITTGIIEETVLRRFLMAAVIIAECSGQSMLNLVRALTVNRRDRDTPWSEEALLDQTISLRLLIPSSPQSGHLTLVVTIIECAECLLYTNFRNWFTEVCRSRELLHTATGTLGLGPGVAQTGDIITYLDTAKNPCVLRPFGEGRYMYLGECYTNDLKNRNDAEKLRNDAGIEPEWFQLY